MHAPVRTQPNKKKSPKAFWLKQLHTWHWVSSAISLLGLLLFAFTGGELNPPAVSPPTNWTENASGELGYLNPTSGAEIAHRDSGFTGATVTWASNYSAAKGVILAEFDTSAAASTAVKDIIGRGIIPWSR